MSRLSTRRKDSASSWNSSLTSPMVGRRLGRARPSISPGTLLGLGGGPASIVAAAGVSASTGQDVTDLDSVNDSER